MAKRKARGQVRITPDPNAWDELLDNPPEITQDMLAECLLLKQRADQARMDADAIGAQIEEMLILGSAVEPGIAKARVEHGRFRVWEEIEPIADNDCPY